MESKRVSDGIAIEIKRKGCIFFLRTFWGRDFTEGFWWAGFVTIWGSQYHCLLPSGWSSRLQFSPPMRLAGKAIPLPGQRMMIPPRKYATYGRERLPSRSSKSSRSFPIILYVAKSHGECSHRKWFGVGGER
ncbi:MAG: hypothetical protein ACYC26_16265, partial [Phycisphaerales bacterium]